MYTRIKQSGSRRYLQIVHGVRGADGRVRQRVIANLGRVDQLKAGALDAVITGLQRVSAQLPAAPRA